MTDRSTKRAQEICASESELWDEIASGQRLRYITEARAEQAEAALKAVQADRRRWRNRAQRLKRERSEADVLKDPRVVALVEAARKLSSRKPSPATGGRMILEVDCADLERALAAIEGERTDD